MDEGREARPSLEGDDRSRVVHRSLSARFSPGSHRSELDEGDGPKTGPPRHGPIVKLTASTQGRVLRGEDDV